MLIFILSRALFFAPNETRAYKNKQYVTMNAIIAAIFYGKLSVFIAAFYGAVLK